MIAGCQRKKVVKKREISSLSLLERDGRPCRGGKLRATSSFVNSLVPMKEKLFQGVRKCTCSLCRNRKSPR